MANIHTVDGSAPLVSGGSLLNLNTVETMNFGNPWWKEFFTETLAIHKANDEYL